MERFYGLLILPVVGIFLMLLAIYSAGMDARNARNSAPAAQSQQR